MVAIVKLRGDVVLVFGAQDSAPDLKGDVFKVKVCSCLQTVVPVVCLTQS